MIRRYFYCTYKCNDVIVTEPVPKSPKRALFSSTMTSNQCCIDGEVEVQCYKSKIFFNFFVGFG